MRAPACRWRGPRGAAGGNVASRRCYVARTREVNASVDVALDGALVAHARVVGIEPGGPARASLVQQVPASIETHAQVLQPLAVVVRGCAERLLLEELVLLVGELVYPRDDVLVVHSDILLDRSGVPMVPPAGRKGLTRSLSRRTLPTG